MAKKRKYKNLHGTNDFLVAAIALLLLGLWAVKDGWFPSESTLEKHPIESVAEFSHAGTVDEIMVEVGQGISSNTSLIEMRTTKLDNKQENLEERLETAREELEDFEQSWLNEDSAIDEQELNSRKTEKQKQIMDIKKEIAGIKQTRMRRILRSNVTGDVKKILVEVGQDVEKGESGAMIHAKDHFYLFNKSLAIGGLIGAVVCAIIHIKLK